MRSLAEAFSENEFEVMDVEPQGTIHETTAAHRDGQRVVVLDLAMDLLLEHPEKLAALHTTGARTPAEMRALLADIPGPRLESGRMVTVVSE